MSHLREQRQIFKTSAHLLFPLASLWHAEVQNYSEREVKQIQGKIGFGTVILMRRNLGLQHFQHVLKVKLSLNSLKNGVFKYVRIKAFRTFYSSQSY